MPGAYLCPGLVQNKITSPPPGHRAVEKKQNSLIIFIIVIKWFWKFREVIFSLMFIIGVIVINLIIFADTSTAWHLGIASLCREQGSFRSLQLFDAGPHQIQRSAAGVRKPLSEETVLRQPQAGRSHDSSTWYRARGVLGLTWYCVVCSFSASAATDTGIKIMNNNEEGKE